MILTSIPNASNPANHSQAQLNRQGDIWTGRFEAMASDCEIAMESFGKSEALELLSAIVAETWRIEAKFSRYRTDNLLFRINMGAQVELDTETQALLDFAKQCYVLSDGLFDITSGVLREIWRFDGGSNVPSDDEVQEILDRIGWNQVSMDDTRIQLKPGMEIDLGGIGKEYAVDRALMLALQNLGNRKTQSVLINFGGDLASTGARVSGKAWRVGIEHASKNKVSVADVELYGGALATSGDSRRYVMHKGKRLPHILNPKTGRPVEGAPSAVTVAAPSCLQAGLLSTLSMLKGQRAESFLKEQGNVHWVQRENDAP